MILRSSVCRVAAHGRWIKIDVGGIALKRTSAMPPNKVVRETVTMETWNLKSVLANNPFNENVITSWREQLEGFKNNAIAFSDLNFSLDTDRKTILGTKQASHTQWQVLPYPFLGHPEAKIWILNINPGFCLMDYFDCLTIGKSDYSEKIVMGYQCSKKDKSALDIIMTKMPDTEDERNRLSTRQESAFKQLQLKGNSFLFLKDCFGHAQLRTRRTIFCGYEWWRRMLFGKDETKKEFLGNVNRNGESLLDWASRNVFNLEFFPYHSTSFYGDALLKSNWCESPYYRFWCSLLMWAVQDENRVFIVRSPELFEKLLNGMAKRGDTAHNSKIKFPHEYLVLRNRRNSWFTTSNIEIRSMSLSEMVDKGASSNPEIISFYRKWFAQFRGNAIIA